MRVWIRTTIGCGDRLETPRATSGPYTRRALHPFLAFASVRHGQPHYPPAPPVQRSRRAAHAGGRRRRLRAQRRARLRRLLRPRAPHGAGARRSVRRCICDAIATPTLRCCSASTARGRIDRDFDARQCGATRWLRAPRRVLLPAAVHPEPKAKPNRARRLTLGHRVRNAPCCWNRNARHPAEPTQRPRPAAHRRAPRSRDFAQQPLPPRPLRSVRTPTRPRRRGLRRGNRMALAPLGTLARSRRGRLRLLDRSRHQMGAIDRQP